MKVDDIFIIDVLCKGFIGKIYKDDLGYKAHTTCVPGFSGYGETLETTIDAYCRMCDTWLSKYQSLAQGIKS